MPRRRATGAATRERLASYGAKRDFTTTPEPPAGGARPGRRPRFVIHEHSARRLHWDLRLEHDGALASWAIPKGLPDAPKDNRLAVHTEDHPLEYLDFKGEIPKGQYGAGTITIWDRGTYEPLKWEPRKIEFALRGRRLRGRYALFAIEPGGQPRDWMIHRMDPPADPARKPMPARVLPMLARAGPLPSGEDERWAYEIKWDGVRAIAYSIPGELRLQSRNLIEIGERYPELARLNRALGSHEAILDGEIVAFDGEGRPSFDLLAQRMQLRAPAEVRRRAAQSPVTYMIFDMLWLDGHSLMELPYAERRRRLSDLGLAGERWQTPEHIVGQGEALLAAAAEQRLEGVLAKRLDSTYEPGVRSRLWLKVKPVGRQEFVIGGWIGGKGARSRRIGALLLGVHDDGGALRYVGRVGTGFSERELERLGGILAPLRRSTSPFLAGRRPPREAVFVEPVLVAEVAFQEWTGAGQLRAPRYVALREDKPAEQVVREPTPARAPAPAGAPARGGRGSGRPLRRTAPAAGPAPRPAAAGGRGAAATRGRGAAPAFAPALVLGERTARGARASVQGRELALSNLDKVLYPDAGFTKGELIDYYAAVAPAILPHLQGRPLTLTRWPDGVQGKSFFQKQAPPHRPAWLPTATVASERKPIDYVLAEDLAALVWLANLAAIELHTPLARAQAIEVPTAVVFDLDPGPPAGVLECARVAVALAGMFENLGLQSLVKSSGSKGLQVYIPLNSPAASYAQTKSFARAVAELLAQSEPELVVSRMTRSQRTGRVLIDWSQNDRRKTTVCAYSLRALERPSVSTPLRWQEVREALDRSDPARLVFEARDVLARVAEHGDLFAEVLSRVQELPSF